MQDQSESSMNNRENRKPFVSTRHRDAEPDTFDPNEPRLGRRESEPHSAEITYLYDVLTTNFPDDRTMWDLHHYFKKNGKELDIQFDITYFKGLQIPYTLTSYHAEKFDNRVPTLAINILSKSTWRSDLAEKLDYCRLLEIPLYVVFPSYHVATEIYKPPFVRAYILQTNGEYKIHELRKITISSSGEWNTDSIIDTSSIVPFRVGLQKRKQKHQEEEPLYRLVLIKPEDNELLLTENEMNKQLIEEQNQKISEQNQKIAEQNQKITEQNQKITEQNQKITEQSQNIEKLEEEISELKKRLNNINNKD